MAYHTFYRLALTALAKGKVWFVSPWVNVRLEKKVLTLFSKDQMALFSEVWVCNSVKEWTLVYSGPEAHAHTAFANCVAKVMASAKPLSESYSFH